MPLVAAHAGTKVSGGAVNHVYAAVANSEDYLDIETTTAQQVPGAAQTVTAPAAGATLIITFSAECGFFGSTEAGENWLELQIKDNGVPVLPTSVSADETPLAFCGGTGGYATNSIQAVERVAAGEHVIRVTVKIHKGNSDTLSASIDDWALTILRAN